MGCPPIPPATKEGQLPTYLTYVPTWLYLLRPLPLASHCHTSAGTSAHCPVQPSAYEALKGVNCCCGGAAVVLALPGVVRGGPSHRSSQPPPTAHKARLCAIITYEVLPPNTSSAPPGPGHWQLSWAGILDAALRHRGDPCLQVGAAAALIGPRSYRRLVRWHWRARPHVSRRRQLSRQPSVN